MITLISNKISFDENKNIDEKHYKYFFGNIDVYEIKLFSVILSNMSGYVISYDGKTKWMFFLIKNDELFKKNWNIWNKVGNSIKKVFDTEPIYNKKISENQPTSYVPLDLNFE